VLIWSVVTARIAWPRTFYFPQKGSEYVVLKDKELPTHCFRGPALDTSDAHQQKFQK